MNTKNPATWLASLFAFVVAADPMSAQSAAPASADQVVELSPFVVNSSKDTGYQAMSTLAGTRLDTPLKDLGASISVYTKDFLDDIGATDTNELFIYATGMEGAGPGGNFTDSNPSNNIDAVVPISNNVRENPLGSARSRGLGAPTFSRNFFIGGINADSYNTERITVLRGPNSALFGVSNPAGIVETSLLRADLRRHGNKVSARIDNEYGLRTTADFNRVLIPDKLAVRLAGVHSREEHNQRPAFEQKERIYGTFTYAPFKSTSVRGNFESGRGRAARPLTALPMNGIANDWLAAGRPGFDWAFYDDPARNPLAASQSSANFYPHYMRQMRLPGLFTIFYNNPGDQRMSYAIRSVTPVTNASVGNAVRQQLLHPLLNRDLAADTPAYTSTTQINEFPVAQFWIGGNVLPGQLSGFIPPGLKEQGFTDMNAFDWENRLIDETANFFDSFHGFNVSVEQRAWQNRIGVELAYDSQRLDRGSRTSWINGSASNNKSVRIDTTVTLPNGLPNPNLGRPYMANEAAMRWQNNHRKDNTLRATAYLKYDFAEEGKSWGKWLGKQLLSGVAERYQNDSVSFQNSHRIDGTYARTAGANISARTDNNVVYLGPSMIGNNNPLKFESIKVGEFPTGPIGNTQYFAREANTTDVGSFKEDPIQTVLFNNGGQLSREVIESKAVTLQSNWLDDHIVTVLGWRSDEDYFDSVANNWVLDPANPNDPGKAIWGFNDINFPRTPPPNVEKETKSYSVVLRWPQKLIKLPGGADLSVFYNNSENFTPAGGRVYPDGNVRSEPQGTTEEYGLNLTVFNGKLTLRVNRFETASTNVSYNPAAYSAILSQPGILLAAWAVEGNTNPQLVASRNADMQRLLSVMPANYLSLYQFQVIGTAPNLTVTRLGDLPGSGDTTDFTAKGIEYEMIYNPTPNWRILANVANQETLKSNSIPYSRAAFARMLPVLQELGGRPAGAYPTGHQLGQPLPANVQTVAQRIDQIITLPLSIEDATAGYPSAEQRNWRFNLVTNYRFGSSSIFGERLRGWSVGGGLRWQGKSVLGFPSSRLADSTPVYNRNNPYYAPAETNIDAFVSYNRKIWGDRIDWRVQLNATNIYTERELLPIAVQPWGQVSAVRLAPAQRWYLTNTFSF